MRVGWPKVSLDWEGWLFHHCWEVGLRIEMWKEMKETHQVEGSGKKGGVWFGEYIWNQERNHLLKWISWVKIEKVTAFPRSNDQPTSLIPPLHLPNSLEQKTHPTQKKKSRRERTSFFFWIYQFRFKWEICSLRYKGLPITEIFPCTRLKGGLILKGMDADCSRHSTTHVDEETQLFLG